MKEYCPEGFDKNPEELQKDSRTKGKRLGIHC